MFSVWLDVWPVGTVIFFFLHRYITLISFRNETDFIIPGWTTEAALFLVIVSHAWVPFPIKTQAPEVFATFLRLGSFQAVSVLLNSEIICIERYQRAEECNGPGPSHLVSEVADFSWNLWVISQLRSDAESQLTGKSTSKLNVHWPSSWTSCVHQVRLPGIHSPGNSELHQNWPTSREIISTGWGLWITWLKVLIEGCWSIGED